MGHIKLVLVLAMVLMLSSCHRNHDSLIGRWTVEKVNVEFDEHIATPEMVKQYGEMEKGNILEITKDSVLAVISEGDTIVGRCALKGTQLYCDSKPFGRYENGTIETESSTPLGGIKVIYRKK